MTIEIPGDLFPTLIQLFATRLGGRLCVRKKKSPQSFLQRSHSEKFYAWYSPFWFENYKLELLKFVKKVLSITSLFVGLYQKDG